MLALVIVLAVFTACGGNETDDVLTMATNAEFPPFEYLENGEVVGADVEIAEAIAEKLGKKLEITNIDFEKRMSGSFFMPTPKC